VTSCYKTFKNIEPQDCCRDRMKSELLPIIHRFNLTLLKVDGNEKLGGPKRRQQLNFSPALWRSRVILNLNVSFLC